MQNKFINGWLAEQESSAMEQVFGDPDQSSLHVVSESDAMALISESAKTPVHTHPFDMAERLFDLKKSPYKKLTTYNQDANNCAGHGTAKAIDAFQLIRCWAGDKYELSPFENFVPWVWGVGKNEVGQPGTRGATIGSMLSMITQNGVLPNDTPDLPDYRGTSNQWARNYGKRSQTAPYSKYWDVAKHFIITAARLPKDADAFYLACKAGYSVAFGTSQRIVMQRVNRLELKEENSKPQTPNSTLNTPNSTLTPTWAASGRWMHAMAAYGYNAITDSVGIDNSHGDGFAWASKSVLNAVVNRARYFDAFVILDMTPRKGIADWSTVGKS